MTRTDDATGQVRDLLAPADPAAPATAGPLDARALQDLRAILSVPRTAVRPRRRTRLPLLLAGTAVTATLATAAALTVLPVGEPLPDRMVTPVALTYRMDDPKGTPRQALLRLADKAARAPRLPGGGPYGYVHTQGWYLGTRVDGRDSVTSAVIPQESRRWMAEDGTGRFQQRTLPPVFPDEAARRAWKGEGEKTSPHTRDGRLDAPPTWTPGSLSTDPRVLARQLTKDHPTSIGPVERLVAVTDLTRGQPVPPALQSAVLRVLAATTDLVYRGRVTDRLGRSGVAFSLDSDAHGLPSRHTLILDPATGRLLGDEEALMGDPGKLRVSPYAVTSYTVYVASGYAPDTRAVP